MFSAIGAGDGFFDAGLWKRYTQPVDDPASREFDGAASGSTARQWRRKRHRIRLSSAAKTNLPLPCTSRSDQGGRDGTRAVGGFFDKTGRVPLTEWTLIEYHGKPAADGPRNRTIANTMAVPVMRWILDRVRAVEDPAASGVGFPHPARHAGQPTGR
jgi:hypothetical protein